MNKYSWVVALNPIGQVIFSPILGFLANKLKGIRLIGIVTSAVFIVANILYAILSVFPTNNGRYAALLISRFLTGATSGVIFSCHHKCTSNIYIKTLCIISIFNIFSQEILPHFVLILRVQRFPVNGQSIFQY